MSRTVQPPRFDRSTVDAFLAHLACAPGGFGLASVADLGRALAPSPGQGPRVLFLLGEPLSGKSTLLSALLSSLWQAGTSSDAPPRFALIRWGDAQRAQRKLGLLAADRVPGDLSAEEFASQAAFVTQHVHDALAELGDQPGLVVAEFPGCTAVWRDGRVQGIDRGFSTCRAFAADERAYFVAVQAEHALRETFLGSREVRPGEATSARQATPLAASRINQLLTELAQTLAQEGRLPGVSVDALAQPEQRDMLIWRHVWPYLLHTEIGAPPERALVALNRPLPADAGPAATEADVGFVDQFDYITARYHV